MSQMQFFKKTDIEIQAAKFSNIEWDVYKFPLIVFNECGSVTPIYTEVDKIPRPLREF